MLDLYYMVGNQRTVSKIEALHLAHGDADKVRFYAMDQVFDHYSWQRPLRSWAELLKERCLQLRDKYDYLCLWFSGGWDSTTVLDAFATNNIRLDEVCIYQREFINDSEPRSALLYAESLKKTCMPNLKINVIDITHRHHDQIYNKFGRDWILTPGCNLMFPKLHRWSLHYELDEVLCHKQKQHNRGDIEAHDKPRITLDQNTWYAFFPDTSLIHYMGTDIEMFYMTPDLPDLHIAQTHMSIDFFEQLLCNDLIASPTDIHRIQSHQRHDFNRYWNEAIGRTCVDNESAISGWLKSTTGQTPMSEESHQLLCHAASTNSKSYRIYQQGLIDIRDQIGIDVTVQTLPTVLSKKWYVREAAARLTNKLSSAIMFEH